MKTACGVVWCNLNADNYNNEIQIYSTFLFPFHMNFLCVFFSRLLARSFVCLFVYSVLQTLEHILQLCFVYYEHLQTGTVMIYLIFGGWHRCCIRHRHRRRSHQFQFKLKCKLERGWTDALFYSIMLNVFSKFINAIENLNQKKKIIRTHHFWCFDK